MGPYFNPGAQGGGKLHAQGSGKFAEKCKQMYFPAHAVDDLRPKMTHPKCFPTRSRLVSDDVLGRLATC